MASATSPITGYGCCCTAASGGRLTGLQDCEAAIHAWWRRAGYLRGVTRRKNIQSRYARTTGTSEALACWAVGVLRRLLSAVLTGSVAIPQPINGSQSVARTPKVGLFR